jgi:membrane protein YqaA with SNARE-associated domain
VVTTPADGGSLFDRLEEFAIRRAGVAALAAWGFGEAIVLPIVPDVLLYLLVAAAPRRALVLFASVVVGAVAGSVLMYGCALSAPDAAARLVLSVPGIDESMLNAARDALATGDPFRAATFGPGTPLKVDTVAWAAGSGTWPGLLLAVVVNRLTRIGPGLVVAAIVGLLAPAWLRRHERAAVIAYVIAWAIFYAVFLS